MVSMAENRSLPDVLRAIVSGIAQCRNVVLARIWLVAPGDICESCRLRPECPDQTRCLRLAASAGNPGDGKENYTRLDGAFRRIPLGVRKVGRAGQSGEPLLLADVRGDEEWIAEPKWMKREGVKTFAGQPLVFRGEVLGVLAIFDTKVLGQEDFNWLRVFADHAAVSIANARAFEEIEILKARLEEENTYLRAEVTSALGVGDTRTRTVNVRIIAATNRDLKKEAEAGRFRQDLFYRLSVFPIEIPPLRERRDDIAPLAAHFVQHTAQRMNRPAPRVTQATLSQLTAHDWPGNVRELQNAVERAVILSQGGPLRFELPDAKAAESAKPHKAPAPSAMLTRDELKRHERESIIAALKQSGGKILGEGGAAELLGMKPTTLASRIKALGLNRKRIG